MSAAHSQAPGSGEVLHKSILEERDQTDEHVLKIENQSNVLDEVDQLVELMTVEKNTLTEKISKLESELTDAVLGKNTLEKTNFQLQTDYSAVKQQLQQLKEGQSKESSSLRKALEAAQKELKETRRKLDSLTLNLSQKEIECTQIHGHHAELKQKLKTLNGEHRNTHAALELQCRENIKLSERCKAISTEKATLSSKLEGAQQRYKHSQDEVLALKGRLTMSKKTQDQLQEKNSALEKALEAANSKSPTIVKVTTRSREELRLLAECKRKDELLARYAEEFSQSRNEQHLQQQSIQRLKLALHKEREERKCLGSTLEANKHESETLQDELTEKLKLCEEKIAAQEKTHLLFSSTKQDLERQLCEIERELREARRELAGLRGEVDEREKRTTKEKKRWESEKEQSRELIRSSREMIENLSKELQSMRLQHSKQVEQLNTQWEAKLKEAREDYRRMKEASTKRCTELAKEVWTLKSRQQNDEHHTSTNHTTS